MVTVKTHMADSGKWNCERCKWDRLRQLEGKLENGLQQIEELKRRNKGLEDQLRGVVAGGIRCRDNMKMQRA
jgi:hypothetical protein